MTADAREAVRRAQPGRTSRGAVVATAGTLAVAASSFLPWAESGAATRTSYELVRAAERLDVVTGSAATAARAWYLVPLLAVGTWVGTALGRPLAVAALATVVALATVALVLAVKGSPLRSDVGTVAAVVSAAVAAIGASVAVGERARRGRGRR